MTGIRSAQLSDADAIANVYVETWRDTYAGLLPDRVLVKMSLERQRTSWTQTLSADQQVLVLEHADGIVGFGSCGHNRVRRLDYTSEIYTLYVLPDFHRCFFQFCLFQKAKYSFQKYSQYFLECIERKQRKNS